MLQSCGQDAGEMSVSGALNAVKLLEDAVWCESPAKAFSLSMSHSDLVREMACVSNKESTFGRDAFGPAITEAGRPFGFW